MASWKSIFVSPGNNLQTQRIHVWYIYDNIYHQYTPVMLAHIPAPWIRHGKCVFFFCVYVRLLEAKWRVSCCKKTSGTTYFPHFDGKLSGVEILKIPRPGNQLQISNSCGCKKGFSGLSLLLPHGRYESLIVTDNLPPVLLTETWWMTWTWGKLIRAMSKPLNFGVS